MAAYIHPVKCNIKILNCNKYPAKGVFLVIIKIPKNIIIPLWPTYYMPQNTQHKISQTPLKRYNQFRNARIEAL